MLLMWLHVRRRDICSAKVQVQKHVLGHSVPLMPSSPPEYDCDDNGIQWHKVLLTHVSALILSFYRWLVTIHDNTVMQGDWTTHSIDSVQHKNHTIHHTSHAPTMRFYTGHTVVNVEKRWKEARGQEEHVQQETYTNLQGLPPCTWHHHCQTAN